MNLINVHYWGQLLLLSGQFLLRYNFILNFLIIYAYSNQKGKSKKKHLLFLSLLFSFHAISYSAERYFFLSSPEEHSGFIRKALTTAQKSVVIVSPFISEHRLRDAYYNNNDGLSRYIERAVKKLRKNGYHNDDIIESILIE